jgi:serine/threonine-protein kinase
VKPEVERLPAAEAAAPKACPSCAKRYPADALFCSLDGSPLTTAPGAIAAAAATDPYVGHEIHGHIEIRQLVGIGAMGRVYRAFQRGIDRDVAVKILHRELSANTALVARFHREAKVASRLAHPNVVHVLLVGQLPDGAMHIVMEYLDGMSLQSALAAGGGAIPLPRALHIVLQLCDAAGEAHAQGIVHRDLKPENVMLVRRADDPDFVKVLDFGIARLNWDEPSTATAAGLIFGTARYISPEGAQGERVGPQGDVYSIATMLYQMLSGRTPFDADQAVALLVQQIHDPPRPLKTVERSAYVPEPVADVIMRNLSKRPEERSADARAFGRALLEAAVGSGLSAQDILARPALIGGARGDHASVVQMPSMQRTKQLALEPGLAARLASPAATTVPAPPQEGRMPLSTAYETPELSSETDAARVPARTEISDPAALAPSVQTVQTVQTVKWAPPDGVGSRLATRLVVPPSSASAAGPDVTLDDQHQAPTPSPRTAVLPPGNSTVGPSGVTPGQLAAGVQPQAPPSAPRAPMPSLPHTPPPPSRPTSSVDATMAGERAPRAIAQGSLVALALACFLLGVGGMSSVAWRIGLLGKAPARAATSASPITRLPDRLPPETDVAPQNPETPPVTARAVEPTRVSDAVPSENSAVPPLVTTTGRPANVPPALTATAPVPHATIDASTGRPGLGQPVDFVARIPGGAHGRVEGAHFQFSGPGLSGTTEVPAADDGTGTYRTTFAFLQTGRFDVRFAALTDGALLSAARTIVVGEAGATSRPPAAPAPAASPAGDKWL